MMPGPERPLWGDAVRPGSDAFAWNETTLLVRSQCLQVCIADGISSLADSSVHSRSPMLVTQGAR